VPLSFEPSAFVLGPIYAHIYSVSALLPVLVSALVIAARTPSVFALSMVLTVAKLAFVRMSCGLKDAITFELTLREVPLEGIPILECDLSVPTLQPILKLPFIDVLAYLF
jgi:hypothetical protein